MYFSLAGPFVGVEFFTGYLVEKSLSVDNIFVFLLIFQSFHVPAESQHRVLFLGVIGALVMRAVFVLAGVELLQLPFHSVRFSALLLLTGFADVSAAASESCGRNAIGWCAACGGSFPVVTDHFGASTSSSSRPENGIATPLFLALVAVEAMDIVFAVDSVPAVLAITRNTFIVYSSNVFAILGLRALYFALADTAAAIPLPASGACGDSCFRGRKNDRERMAADFHAYFAGNYCGILAITVVASLLLPRSKRKIT